MAHELDVGLDSGVGRLVRVRVRGRDKVRVRVRVRVRVTVVSAVCGMVTLSPVKWCLPLPLTLPLTPHPSPARSCVPASPCLPPPWPPG